MDWGSLLELVLPVVATFIVGLFVNKPGYTKGKNVLKVINKAIDDDKLSPEEYAEIKALFSKGEE